MSPVLAVLLLKLTPYASVTDISIIVGAVVLVLTTLGGAIAWLWSQIRQAKIDRNAEVSAVEDRMTRGRESDRTLLMAEFERSNAELQRTRDELGQVAPTISMIRKEYTELAQKNIELMDQVLKLKAEQVAERRKYLAMIGGISMQLNDLRRFFTATTGLTLPPVNDPLQILAEAEAEALAAGHKPDPLPTVPTLPEPPPADPAPEETP